MSSKHTGPGRREDRPPRRVEPKRHDTYRRDEHAGAFVCEECGVVRHAGRWYWGAPPVGEVTSGRCPACERARDRYPAGTLRLRGAVLEHEEEVRGLVANQEAAEKPDHPLERLMAVEREDDALVVTTTGIHLARRIASALERRFYAKAKYRYPDEQHLLFVDLDA